jgi:hypothetical protein
MVDKQPARRSMPTEPQNCLNHRTVQKSFLNQICDDCLLAELDATSVPSDRDVLLNNRLKLDVANGEGLIWDSEVKIEVEGRCPVAAASPIAPNLAQQTTQPVEEEDHMIFESHVEITIEPFDRSLSVDDFTSPSSTTFRDRGSSLASPLSVGSSPLTAHSTYPSYSTSPALRKTKNMRNFRNKPMDLEDADDELENRKEAIPSNGRVIPRGRSSNRSHLSNVENGQPVADIPPQVANARLVGKGASRMHGLRSLSTPFLPASRVEVGGAEQNSPTNTATTLPSSKPRSKNPFRSIRKQNYSSSTPHPSAFDSPSSNAAVYGNLEQVKRESQSGIPMRSSLKDFALLLVQDLRRAKTPRSSSGSQVSSLSQKPARLRTPRSDSNVQHGAPRSAAHSDTVFETASNVTSVKSNETWASTSEEGKWISSTSPVIPRSSTMNTLRAVINDLRLGLDKQDTRTSQSSMAAGGHTASGAFDG